MSRIGTIARRTFLIGSAAIAGGVAFGVYSYRRPHANPLLDHLPDGEIAITPYIKIDAGGVTLITPRADLGQGAYSVQAALIAEELDIELDQIKADPGPPSPAYYNTALSEEGAPFRSTDDSFLAESARGVVDALMKFLGLQITGGSTTVPDSFDKLRMAGAVAREALKEAASEKSGVPVARLKTARGAVQLPDGSELTYVSLAKAAADIVPVRSVTLRDPSQWRLIGKPMRRIDIVAKSTGTQIYGIDMRLEGMVYATVKMNPRRGGALNDYDASAAEKMRGVRKIIPLDGGVGVIADNSWRAMRAAEAITFEWGPAPYPAEMDGHWQALAASFNDKQIESQGRDDGDVEAALGGALKVIEAEYRAPYLAHAPLEPVSAIVKVTDSRADVWVGTQIPRFVQNNVATITGVPFDDVYVHVQMVGGSFGHRLEDEFVKQAAELAVAMRVRR